MLGLLISLVIIFLVLGICYWIVSLFPLPAPWPLVVQAVFGLIALIILVDLLMGISGSGGGHVLLWR